MFVPSPVRGACASGQGVLAPLHDAGSAASGQFPILRRIVTPPPWMIAVEPVVQAAILRTVVMTPIERTITVSFEHRVFFTRECSLDLANSLLKEVLEAEPGQLPKVFLVLDESLHLAQPALAPQIEGYFRKFGTSPGSSVRP